jgi:hypothetical protein
MVLKIPYGQMLGSLSITELYPSPLNLFDDIFTFSTIEHSTEIERNAR